jgi:uncharacterized protein
MNEIIAAFITGLTAGGLSCMAVQGGLLAGSLANQIEDNIRNGLPRKHKLVNPILIFLTTKLIAYTLLGFGLGWIGNLFQFSPITRAMLQIAIGIFMVGNALRMLNVHPVFRFFNFEPPQFIRKAIRRISKKEDDWMTPMVLGLMTIFIPCGITQSIMSLAMAGANPLFGAALMFAYTIGTTPLFFAVAYFASQLGARLEKGLTVFVAVVLLVLGLVSIYSGGNLLPSPLLKAATQNEVLLNKPINPLIKPEPQQTGNNLTINVVDYGFQPNKLNARANEGISLRLVTNKTVSCSRAFVIPSLNVGVILPETGEKTLKLSPQPAGTVLKFTCSMGMYSGEIIFS